MQVRLRSIAAASLAAFLFAFPAFVLAQNYPPAVGQLVANTKKQIKTVNMADFKASLDKKDLGTIVDVREPGEFAEGHIPGAVNVPRGLLEFTIWDQVGYPDKTDMNKRLTLYCKTGGRASLATKTLADLGFTNVVVADMKIEDWTKAGYPLAK